MAKAATKTTTKAATKRANTKTTKDDKDVKPKRAPSAYNLFVKAQMKEWKLNHPNAPIQEAMREISALWSNAPENPKCGKGPKTAKTKSEGVKKASARSKAASRESEEELSEWSVLLAKVLLHSLTPQIRDILYHALLHYSPYK